MFFSAATEPGTRDSPNEDWVAVSPTTAIVLDGVTVFKEFQIGCIHGTPWYVNKLGTRFLAAAADQNTSLRSALRTAISSVADIHSSVCDLEQIGAPSAAVAALRINERFVEYLVLADVTILIQSVQGLTVVSDERVASAEGDLAGRSDFGAEVMKRRERYRNKEGGYWVAAADPDVVEHAKVGQVSLDGFQCAAMMSDGVSRLVAPFEQTNWQGFLALTQKVGPAALIECVRRVEADDTERTRWPRFKVSDDATIALISP
jgi:hypothetical protein